MNQNRWYVVFSVHFSTYIRITRPFFPSLYLELFQNQGTNTYTVKWMNYSDSSSCYLMNNPAQTYCSHLRYKNSFRSHTGRGQLEVMWEGVSMGTVMSKWGRVQGPRAVMQFVPPFVRITVEIKGRTYNRIDYTWPNEDLVWNRPPGKKGRKTKMLETYIFNILLNYSLKVLHFLQTQPRLGLYLSPFLHWLLWVSVTVALIKSQTRYIKNIFKCSGSSCHSAMVQPPWSEVPEALEVSGMRKKEVGAHF